MARDSNTSQRPPNPRRGRFATTRWSLVRGALRRSKPGSRQALAELFDIYWYPLYSEARRMGLDPEVARDRVQGFFTRLLETDGLAGANQTRGRFRSFLLAAFHHFLANEWDRERAGKRGGGRPIASLDQGWGEFRLALEPVHHETPERIFDRRWAVALIDQVLGRLRKEYEKAGKAKLFEVLSPALVGDRGVAYTELARALEMTEGAVKTAVHRLRARCAALVREAIARTVTDAAGLDEELAHLFAALES